MWVFGCDGRCWCCNLMQCLFEQKTKKKKKTAHDISAAPVAAQAVNQPRDRCHLLLVRLWFQLFLHLIVRIVPWRTGFLSSDSLAICHRCKLELWKRDGWRRPIVCFYFFPFLQWFILQVLVHVKKKISHSCTRSAWNSSSVVLPLIPRPFGITASHTCTTCAFTLTGSWSGPETRCCLRHVWADQLGKTRCLGGAALKRQELKQSDLHSVGKPMCFLALSCVHLF